MNLEIARIFKTLFRVSGGDMLQSLTSVGLSNFFFFSSSFTFDRLCDSAAGTLIKRSAAFVVAMA